MPARVVVLAGPSGAGKSRLAERIGLPVLRLDDFYKDGGESSLPRIDEGPNTGLVDWDHPDSWLQDEAVTSLAKLCADGTVDVPIYEIAKNGRTGWHFLDLEGAPLVVAEGIFAQEIVPELTDRGLLAAAYCVRQHRLVTFWRRLVRDLREHRKPPLVLLRRGFALLRDQQRLVRHAQALGCQAVTPDQAYGAVRGLR